MFFQLRFWGFMAAIKVAICAWVALAMAWTRAIASACSFGGGTAVAGAKGVLGIAAVTFPAWYPAWLEVVRREEWSCSASVNNS